MSAILPFLKKAWVWITRNVKLFLLILGIILFVVLVLWWGHKNKMIRSLKNKLAIAQAKLKIEKLAGKYDATMDDLKGLKEKDKKISDEIAVIEKSLEERLKPDMTAEEIVAAFKKIGL